MLPLRQQRVRRGEAADLTGFHVVERGEQNPISFLVTYELA